jgi:predicted kinase
MAEFLDKLIVFDTNTNSYHYDWDEISKVPEFMVLKDCEQSPKWHSEGSVWNHTKAVCEVMQSDVINSDLYGCVSHFGMDETLHYNDVNWYVKLLLTAALFHDIGKGTTTFEKDGEFHAYRHEFDGERITRLLLWDEGYQFRENVCELIRYHMDVLKVFDSKDPYIKIFTMSKNVCMNALLCLKYADCFGSKPTVENSHDIDKEKLSELYKICRDAKCLWRHSEFITNGEYPWKKYKQNNKQKINLCVMIGLPGSGKDTYIHNALLNGNCSFLTGWNYSNTVVISRDDIRIDLGFCTNDEKIVGTKEQEIAVTKEFNTRIKAAAAKGKNIIINNVNTRRKYRDYYKETLKEFNLNILYVYVENCKLNDLIERRKGQIPSCMYLPMILKFEWPANDEYNEFHIIHQ